MAARSVLPMPSSCRFPEFPFLGASSIFRLNQFRQAAFQSFFSPVLSGADAAQSLNFASSLSSNPAFQAETWSNNWLGKGAGTQSAGNRLARGVLYTGAWVGGVRLFSLGGAGKGVFCVLSCDCPVTVTLWSRSLCRRLRSAAFALASAATASRASIASTAIKISCGVAPSAIMSRIKAATLMPSCLLARLGLNRTSRLTSHS